MPADNPVADAGDYRLELLVSTRPLRVLDDIPFEAEELNEANEVGPARGQQAMIGGARSLTPG